MPGHRFWILAASLSLTAAMAAEPTPGDRGQRDGEPSIEARSFASEDGGHVMVATDGRLQTRDTFLSARTIRRDDRTGVIVAEGDVVYATKELRIMGARISVDPRTDTIEAVDVRFGRSPVYFTAESLRIVKGDKTVRGVRVWNGEPAPRGMHLRIAELNYVESTDRLSMRSATSYASGVPLFNLPYYGQKGYRDFPYDIWFNTGNENKQGGFLRTTVLTKVNPSLWAGGLVDYYSRSGILVGPALRFDNTKQAQGGAIWKGSLQSGWIDDQTTPLADVYGRLADNQRAFLLGQLNGRTLDGTEITANAFAQSDPDVLRDFRPFLIGQNGNPQVNVEAVKAVEGGYLSAGLTAKADDYQDVVQRLPELRFDLPTGRLAGSTWDRRAFISLGYFTERPSEDLPLPAFQAATLSPTAWSSARLDGYYGLSRAFRAGDWLSWRPVAGVRATGWSDGIDGQGAASKVIGQAGFDLEALVTGSWDFRAEKWGVDGLRHSLRPMLQYRVMPGADEQIGVAPMTQRAVSLTVLEELDLADRLDAASTTDRQAVRFGVRNTLETRDGQDGTRELARADFFADWRQGPTEAETGRSDLLGTLRFTPTSWLTVSSGVRLPNGGGAPLESLQSVGVNSGDFWQSSLSWVELRQAAVARQLIWDGRVRLNSVYSVIGGLNYDAILGQTTFMSAGLIQRVGNSWELEYGVNKRLDPLNRGIGSLGFHLRFRLFRF